MKKNKKILLTANYLFILFSFVFVAISAYTAKVNFLGITFLLLLIRIFILIYFEDIYKPNSLLLETVIRSGILSVILALQFVSEIKITIRLIIFFIGLVLFTIYYIYLIKNKKL